MSVRFIGAEAAAGTSAGASSNFELATEVRLVNLAAAEATITILNGASGTNVQGSFTLEAGASEYISKDMEDRIYASAATVKGVPINTRR
mgnify:FL=1|jgi:hypothetical protein|tara:strand:+ start:890 stop:1159 length:270 start_codon:yes stop_codon:yes gene_type:complete